MHSKKVAILLHYHESILHYFAIKYECKTISDLNLLGDA